MHAADAVFYARYVVNRLIDGQGGIAISPLSNQPTLLDWPVGGIMLREPHWKDRPRAPVKLGAWGTENIGIERSGLHVAQPGILLFGFQATATSSSEESAQFVIASPRALRRRIYLDLPEHYELAVEGGSIELLTSPTPEVIGSLGPLLELPPLGLGYRRWLFTGGPGGTTNIQVRHPPRPPAPRSDTPAYRERLIYQLEPQGMELTAELEFPDGRILPSELTIELEAPLKLIDVQWQGMPVRWQEQPANVPGPTRYRLTLATSAIDVESPLQLTAWSELPRGELRRLPQLSSPDLFWLEGRLEVNVAEELQLLDLRTGGLSPLPVAPDDAENNRRWQFAKHRQSATADVAIRAAIDSVDARIGTSLELSSASTKAIIRMQLRTSGQSLPPRIEAEVLGGWEIDSVESSSAINFTDWYVEQVDGKRILRVLFRGPEDATYPGEVVIEAHLKKSVAVESLPLAELMPVEWRLLAPRRHILAVTVIEPLDLQMTGSVSRLTFDDLNDNDWELLENSDVAALVLMNEADLSAQLRLMPERPTFSGDTEIVAHVEGNVVRQQATVRMESQRNPISKIRVQFSPPPTAEIRWADPQTGVGLSAAKTPAAADSHRREIWEVQLARGGSSGQSLQIEWVEKLGEKHSLPLVALPDAAKQTARIEIAGKSSHELTWESNGLVQQPLAIAGKGPAPRATFRYDPVQLLDISTACYLVLRSRSAMAALPAAVLERVELASRYLPEAASVHRARFTLRATGDLRCRLPDGSKLLSVTSNGQIVRHMLRAGELQLATSAAPPGATPSVLQLDFTLPQEELGDGLSLAAPLPELGLPLPAGVWSVELPASYQLATPEYLQSIEPSWIERLLIPWRQWTLDASRSSTTMTTQSAPGWRKWEIHFVGTTPADVSLMQLSHRYALAYGIGLAVACLTAWQLVRRPSLLAVLLIAGAITALWLPASSSFLATAVWLGMLAGIAWKILAIAFTLPRVAPAQASLSLRSLPGINTALWWIMLAGLPQQLNAQAAPPSNPASSHQEKLPRILIPVDDQGIPEGDKYFVPATFWEELLRKSENQPAKHVGDWVILRGTYSGELRDATAGTEPLATAWSLSWEVDVQRRDALVYLPLDRAQGKWPPTASIDGIPAPLKWNPAGEGCTVRIGQPGLHRIAVRVEPLVKIEGSQARLSLRLPPLLDAQMHLTYPTALEALKLPGEAIPAAVDPQRSKVSLPLAQSETLELSWRTKPVAAVSAVVWEVEQLELLTISPDGAELEVRLMLQGSGTPPAEIRVEVDRLLAPLDFPRALAEDTPSGADRHIVSVPVTAEPTTMETQRASATLRFSLPRHQVVGSYRYPEVNLRDLTARSKVAAVALSPQLVQEMIQNPAGETLDESEFSELWGGGALSAPVVAYRLAKAQSPWTFAVTPRVATTPPEESLLVACGLSDLEVQYQALFAHDGPPLVQQTLIVSPSLGVRSVELGLSTGTQPLRWTRPAPDRVVAFFPRPLQENFSFVLKGEVALKVAGSHRIPTVAARASDNLPQRVQIHRRSECLVEVDGPSAMGSVSDFTISSPWGNETSPVKAFLERPDRIAQLTLKITENPVESTAQTITVFDPEVGVSSVGRIRVLEGILDRVTLEVPADWIGPLHISPAAEVVELGSSTPGRREVELRLSNSIPKDQALVLRFSGSVAATKDGTWQVPVLRLLGPEINESWVAVPAEQSSTDQTLTLQGVVPADLPALLAKETKLTSPVQVFRVARDRDSDFVVRRSPTAQEHPLALLALADVHVREDGRGAQLLNCQFLLPPLASQELTVEWPTGHVPLGVFLENRQLAPRSNDGRRWDLPIGPTDLPILLTTVSRAPPGRSSDEVKLERPQIWEQDTPYPIPLTLWSIDSRRSLSVLPSLHTTLTTDAEYAMLRLARVTQLVSSVEPRLDDLPFAERMAWKGVWLARLRSHSAALEKADRQTPLRAEQEVVIAESVKSREQLLSQATQLQGRLFEPPESTAAQNGNTVVFTTMAPPGSASEPGDQDQPPRRFATSGTQSLLALEVDPRLADSKLPLAIGTIVLVAGLGTLLRLAPRMDMASFLARHPRWLVAGLGIAWWAFLAPAAIGLALLLAACLSWAAQRWYRPAAFPPPG